MEDRSNSSATSCGSSRTGTPISSQTLAAIARSGAPPLGTPLRSSPVPVPALSGGGVWWVTKRPWRTPPWRSASVTAATIHAPTQLWRSAISGGVNLGDHRYVPVPTGLTVLVRNLDAPNGHNLWLHLRDQASQNNLASCRNIVYHLPSYCFGPDLSVFDECVTRFDVQMRAGGGVAFQRGGGAEASSVGAVGEAHSSLDPREIFTHRPLLYQHIVIMFIALFDACPHKMSLKLYERNYADFFSQFQGWARRAAAGGGALAGGNEQLVGPGPGGPGPPGAVPILPHRILPGAAGPATPVDSDDARGPSSLVPDARRLQKQIVGRGMTSRGSRHDSERRTASGAVDGGVAAGSSSREPSPRAEDALDEDHVRPDHLIGGAEPDFADVPHEKAFLRRMFSMPPRLVPKPLFDIIFNTHARCTVLCQQNILYDAVSSNDEAFVRMILNHPLFTRNLFDQENEWCYGHILQFAVSFGNTSIARMILGHRFMTAQKFCDERSTRVSGNVLRCAIASGNAEMVNLVLHSRFMTSDIFAQRNIPYYRNVLFLAVNAKSVDVIKAVFLSKFVTRELLLEENRSCKGSLETFAGALGVGEEALAIVARVVRKVGGSSCVGGGAPSGITKISTSVVNTGATSSPVVRSGAGAARTKEKNTTEMLGSSGGLSNSAVAGGSEGHQIRDWGEH